MSDKACVLCRGLCTNSSTSGISNKEILSAALQNNYVDGEFKDDVEEDSEFKDDVEEDS